MKKNEKKNTLNKELRHPIWDKVISPGITKLKRQHLRPLPADINPDPLQFVITAILLPNFSTASRTRIFNFIRRAAIAYDSYKSARKHYNRFFRDNDHHSFLQAINSFEICLAATYHGHELLFALTGKEFKDKNSPGRGELNWRMDRLYNKSKHIEGMIKAQNYEGNPVMMWLSNDGLHTNQESISFDELNGILFDMCLTASVMAKSHLWRKEIPPLLEKYSKEIFRIKGL